MHDIKEELEQLCEYVEKEIHKANEKLRTSGGNLSAGDVEYIDNLTHTMKSLKTTLAMLGNSNNGGSYEGNAYEGNAYEGNAYEGNAYDGSYDGMRGAYARGRGRYAKRDSRGRYASEPGYSRDEEMVQELRELMKDAPDEKTRQEFQKFIMKIQSM